ncbi:MAG: FAD-dependent oxidoreductase, partial [Planctomycetota bacterium]
VDESHSRDSMLEMTGKHSSWSRYQEFLSLQSAIAELVWPTMLSPLKCRDDFRAELKTEALREAWDCFVERPLGEAVESFAEHDALRGLLMTDGKIGVFTHPHDASLLQNRCFLYHVIGNATGEWRVPVGGMKRLVDSLVATCQRFSVQFAVESPAVDVACGNDRHEVTFLSDGMERCATAENVLINAAPQTFCQLLRRTWEPETASEGSVIKINMLLKRLPELKAVGISSSEAFSGSFHIDEGYQQMLDSYAEASAGAIPDPTPGEVYCHTLTDPSILSKELQERGFHTLTLFGLDMPWRLFESDHDAKKKVVAERYLAGLDRLTKEPFRNCLALDADGEPCFEIKTPQDLKDEVDLDQGNIFHNELSWFFGEPDTAGSWGVETDLPGIYRAGSSANRGGAVSGIPGHNAAMKILGVEA